MTLPAAPMLMMPSSRRSRKGAAPDLAPRLQLDGFRSGRRPADDQPFDVAVVQTSLTGDESSEQETTNVYAYKHHRRHHSKKKKKKKKKKKNC